MAALCAIVYAHHIEAPLALSGKPAKIVSHHNRNLPPLVLIDGRFAGFHIARAARLHFDKAENIFVPADKVYFPAAARRTEVARDYRVTEFSQMEVRGFLAAATGNLVSRRFIAGKGGASGDPVEASQRCYYEWPRQHG